MGVLSNPPLFYRNIGKGWIVDELSLWWLGEMTNGKSVLRSHVR